jgi:hypothetical protein
MPLVNRSQFQPEGFFYFLREINSDVVKKTTMELDSVVVRRSNIVRALPRKGLKEHQKKEGLSCKKNS